MARSTFLLLAGLASTVAQPLIYDCPEMEPLVGWYSLADVEGVDELNQVEFCDDCTQTVDLPFAFEWFGETISQIEVDSNGQINIDFDGAIGCCSARPVDGYHGESRIAFTQSDLHPENLDSAEIYYLAKEDSVIVSFEGVPWYATIDEVWAQVEMCQNGTIEIRWGNGTMVDSRSIAVGVEKDQFGAWPATSVSNEAFVGDSLEPGIAYSWPAYDGVRFECAGNTAPPTSTLAPTPNELCLDFEMSDTWGDGWNGAVYTFFDTGGTELASGTLSSGSYAVTEVCFPERPACYSIEVTSGNWPSEIDWTLGGILDGGAPDSKSFILTENGGFNLVGGCTAAPTSTFAPTTAVPTPAPSTHDPTPKPTTHAPTLTPRPTFAACFTLFMSDSWGDGWNGADYNFETESGELVATGTLASGSSGEATICFPTFDQCYVMTVGRGDWPGEISWTIDSISGGAEYATEFYISSDAELIETACTAEPTPEPTQKPTFSKVPTPRPTGGFPTSIPTPVPSLAPKSSKKKSDSVPIALIAGVAAAGVVLCIVIAVVLFFCVCKKSSGAFSDTSEKGGYQDHYHETTPEVQLGPQTVYS